MRADGGRVLAQLRESPSRPEGPSDGRSREGRARRLSDLQLFVQPVESAQVPEPQGFRLAVQVDALRRGEADQGLGAGQQVVERLRLPGPELFALWAGDQQRAADLGRHPRQPVRLGRSKGLIGLMGGKLRQDPI